MKKSECEKIIKSLSDTMMSITVTTNSLIFDQRLDIFENGTQIKQSLGDINTKLMNIITVANLASRMLDDTNVDINIEMIANNVYLALNCVAMDLQIFTAELITMSTDDGFFELVDGFVRDFNGAYDKVIKPLDEFVSFETKEIFKAIEQANGGEDLV